jgi:hypothetical protein
MAPREKGIHNNLELVHNQMNKKKHYFGENTFKFLGKKLHELHGRINIHVMILLNMVA